MLLMSALSIILITVGVVAAFFIYVIVAIIYGFATLPFKIARGETREWEKKQKELKKRKKR